MQMPNLLPGAADLDQPPAMPTGVGVRIRDAVGEAMQNTDVMLNLCKATKTDLCPSMAALCQDQSGMACQKLAAFCKKGDMQLKSNVCLQADAQLCDATAQICKKAKPDSPGAAVCAVLQNLCTAK